MSVSSYEPGTKKVIFDSAGTLASGGSTINSLGDEIWFTPFRNGDQLPEKFTIEVDVSGTISAGDVDVEGNLGQEPGFSGPTVIGDKAASPAGPWVQIATQSLTGVDAFVFVVDKKVRGVRIKLSTAIVGGGRAIVSIAA